MVALEASDFPHCGQIIRYIAPPHRLPRGFMRHPHPPTRTYQLPAEQHVQDKPGIRLSIGRSVWCFNNGRRHGTYGDVASSRPTPASEINGVVLEMTGWISSGRGPETVTVSGLDTPTCLILIDGVVEIRDTIVT